MRDIKFRGLTTGMNSHWVIGYLCKKFEDDVRIYNVKMQVWSSVLPETVCEYTGLKSRSGREIFEGDVLQYDGELYDVEWHLGGFWAIGRGHTSLDFDEKEPIQVFKEGNVAPLDMINEGCEIVGTTWDSIVEAEENEHS